MPGWVFAGIVFVFLAGGVVFVRRRQRGAFVDRFPVEDGESTLLEEDGLKVFHRARKAARFGKSGTTTFRVRARLTDRRILIATGGPEGTHKLVLKLVLDYTTPADPVPGSGFAAYWRKFHLANGYPTYAVTAADATVEQDDGRPAALRVEVPFPEAGPRWGPPPEVALYTAHADRYREAIARRPG